MTSVSKEFFCVAKGSAVAVAAVISMLLVVLSVPFMAMAELRAFEAVQAWLTEEGTSYGRPFLAALAASLIGMWFIGVLVKLRKGHPAVPALIVFFSLIVALDWFAAFGLWHALRTSFVQYLGCLAFTVVAGMYSFFLFVDGSNLISRLLRRF